MSLYGLVLFGSASWYITLEVGICLCWNCFTAVIDPVVIALTTCDCFTSILATDCRTNGGTTDGTPDPNANNSIDLLPANQGTAQTSPSSNSNSNSTHAQGRTRAGNGSGQSDGTADADEESTVDSSIFKPGHDPRWGEASISSLESLDYVPVYRGHRRGRRSRHTQTPVAPDQVQVQDQDHPGDDEQGRYDEHPEVPHAVTAEDDNADGDTDPTHHHQEEGRPNDAIAEEDEDDEYDDDKYDDDDDGKEGEDEEEEEEEEEADEAYEEVLDGEEDDLPQGGADQVPPAIEADPEAEAGALVVQEGVDTNALAAGGGSGGGARMAILG